MVSFGKSLPIQLICHRENVTIKKLYELLRAISEDIAL